MSALDHDTSLDDRPDEAVDGGAAVDVAEEPRAIDAVAAPPAPAWRARTYALLLAGLVVAAAAGWLAGGALDRRQAPPAPPHVVAAGRLRIAVAGTWRPAAVPRPLSRLELRGLRTFAPVVGAPATVWTARARVDGPTLLPAALRAAVGPLPRPRNASLGGRPAWAYRGLSLAGGTALDVLVAPTRKGSVIVGCSAPFAWWSSVAGCERDVVAVSGARSLRPAAALAARRALPRVIHRLDRARRAGARRLHHAHHPRGVARAARGIAAAHRRAARRLAPLLPARRRGVIHALRRSARAYTEIAVAARHHRPVRYRHARNRVHRADAALRRALTRAR